MQLRSPFDGALECDETLFGGRRPGKWGWGAAGKIIVFGVLKGRDHINGIEGFWSYAKHWLYPYRGVPRKFFHLYLGEVCYRFNHRQENLKPLIFSLMQHLNYDDIRPLLVRNG